MKTFKNKSEDFKLNTSLIGSQWRLRRIGVTCSNFLLRVTSLAAEFCTRWSLVLAEPPGLSEADHYYNLSD